MKLHNVILDIINLDGDEYTDGNIIDMIFELCIAIKQGKSLQEARDAIYKSYEVLDDNKK